MGARLRVCPERIAAMIEELGSRMAPTGTVYADNGEVDISFVDGRVVLDVREGRPAGEDRVFAQNADSQNAVTVIAQNGERKLVLLSG